MGESADDVPEKDLDSWATRPFAATFDLVLSQYAGYTDESLLNVSLERLHQMRELILERQQNEMLSKLMLEEVKLQAICGSIHAAAGNKAGAKEASRIQLFERERVVTVPDESRVARMFGA